MASKGLSQDDQEIVLKGKLKELIEEVGIISDFDIPIDQEGLNKAPFDNLRSLALVDEEGDLSETADLRKFKDTRLFDEFEQIGDRSHLKNLPAVYEDINGKEVKSLINKDKWNLNTKLYHNKYQLNKKKKVDLLEYNEENPKHYRLSDMTEDDDDYNEVLGWYDDYKKKKGEKIAEIKNIIEKLYPDTRPKKKSRRSSGGVPPSPTGGDSSDSD